MPVLNLQNFSIFFYFSLSAEEGGLISKQPVYQYNMLNCDVKERFQNHTWLLSFVDITKFACESLEF